MPKPTDGGKTYTFKIREGVKFHDGSPLTAADVAASWNEDHLSAARASSSARQSNFVMVDKVEAPDPTTVVFRLKFATDAFLPALADPYAFIYSKDEARQGPALVREEHPRLGPVQICRVRDRPVDHAASATRIITIRACPISTASQGIFADKQAVRVEAIRADRAAIEFRGFPPSVRDELVRRARRQDHGADQRLELRRHHHDRTTRKSRSTMPACAAR